MMLAPVGGLGLPSAASVAAAGAAAAMIQHAGAFALPPLPESPPRKRKADDGLSTPDGCESPDDARRLRQQELNKAAQQRYRQRRKEKHEQLEASLDEHKQRLQQAAGRAAQLEARVRELEAALAQGPTAAAAASRVPLPEAAPQAISKPSCGAGATCPPGAAGCCAPVAPAAPPAAPAAQGQCVSYCAAIVEVQSFVREHGLQELLRAGAPLPPALLAPLHESVAACAKACGAAVDVAAPGALPLLVRSADGDGCCIAPGEAAPPASARARRVMQRCRWLQAIADIALSDKQIDSILEMRTLMLRSLNACFAEREALAERLAALATSLRASTAPRHNAHGGGSGSDGVEASAGSPPGCGSSASAGGGASGAPSDRGPLLTAQAERLRVDGYLRGGVATGSLETSALLEQMQANLQAEGALLHDFTHRLLTRTLAPIQAAVLAASTFPYSTDVMGLANALSEVYYTAPALLPLLPGAAAVAATTASRPSAALVAAAAATAAIALRRDADASEEAQAPARPSVAAGCCPQQAPPATPVPAPTPSPGATAALPASPSEGASQAATAALCNDEDDALRSFLLDVLPELLPAAKHVPAASPDQDAAEPAAAPTAAPSCGPAVAAVPRCRPAAVEAGPPPCCAVPCSLQACSSAAAAAHSSTSFDEDCLSVLDMGLDDLLSL